ncbi:MAG TPA: hypothetical protein VMA55_06465 [Acidovorax sp.]|nr:hypothetical protein [Acidovorax sp.]
MNQMQNTSRNSSSTAIARILATTAVYALSASGSDTSAARRACRQFGRCSSAATGSCRSTAELLQAEIDKHKAKRKEEA